MTPVHLHVLTVPELKCFHRCQREHLYSYRLGVRPLFPDEPLRFGAVVRAGLNAWWRAAMEQLPPEEWLHAALAVVALIDGGDNPFDRVRAEELLAGYHARWAQEPWEILGVGVEFETPLVNPATAAPSKTFLLGGKINALVRSPDGRILVVEHRTSSEDISPDADYWRRLQLDAQVSTYFVGGRSLGHDVAGCIYDVLGRVRLQPYEATAPEARKYKKDGSLYANQRERAESVDEFRARVREHIAANPERYFARGEAVCTEEDRRDAAFDTWQTARAMADAERLDRAPRNEQSCVRWGRTCDYFAVCTRETSIEDETRYRRVGGGTETDGAERAA